MRVSDGDPRTLPYLFHLKDYRQCDDVLRFLVAHRLTGPEFMRWVKSIGWSTPLGAASNAIAIVEKWSENRTIQFGRDIVQ